MPSLGNPHCYFKRALFYICAVGLFAPLFFGPLFLGGVKAAEKVRAIGVGEAFITRFSGVAEGQSKAGQNPNTININGVVGSVVDIRTPLAKAMGQHWRDENQRFEILASEVGQVFGIAFDDASPPNIYVSATSTFGLHRNGDNSDWANGMWGTGGNPGTIYKLNALNDYAPQIFAQVKLGRRQNSGPALGNLAFDKVSQQLFVSDLETGMIHRFDIKTGKDLGHFDHGVTGRSQFFDRATGEMAKLKPEHFKEDCFAQFKECDGAFANTPSCWNFASANRRVWGLDVRTMPDGSRRLFYATWGSVDTGSVDAGSPDAGSVKGADEKNWIWSVALDKDGGFGLDNVAREFALPALKINGRTAFSAPADLSFSTKGDLLIGERGAPRNYLGFYQSPFARPTISRSFEYVLGLDGRWKMAGQYDVGNRPVPSKKQSVRFDNSAGGVAWGFGYNKFGKIDTKSPDQFVWISGDHLCGQNAPCFDPAAGKFSDRHHVVGIEGRARRYYRGNLDASYKIDSDINVHKNGQLNVRQALKNDDSQGAGDVEIYQGRNIVKAAGPVLTPKILPRPKPEMAAKTKPKTVAAPIVLSKPKPRITTKGKPKPKVVMKRVLKTKPAIKKRAKKRVVKKKIRHKLRKKVRKRAKRKVVRKKSNRRVVRKTRNKRRVKCNCDCNCTDQKPTSRAGKRVLHPSGKADYSGAGKVKLFVPTKP